VPVSLESNIDFSSNFQLHKSLPGLSSFIIRSCVQYFVSEVLFYLFLECFTLKMRTLPSFEISGTSGIKIQRHITKKTKPLFVRVVWSARWYIGWVSLRWKHVRTLAAHAVCVRGGDGGGVRGLLYTKMRCIFKSIFMCKL
jgi:hypothetical protein